VALHKRRNATGDEAYLFESVSREEINTRRERRKTAKRFFAVPVTMALILAVLSISRASIPDAGGVIHGCYNKSGGTVRVIDSSVIACGSNETAISWNQTGPAGPRGPQVRKDQPGRLDQVMPILKVRPATLAWVTSGEQGQTLQLWSFHQVRIYWMA
jgi:hypothetical protein